MRKVLWMIMLLGGYIWLVTSGHDEFVLDQGKMAYKALVDWFDDAQVDFHLKKDFSKKRSRRWD